MSSDNRGPSGLSLLAHPQADAASMRGCSSQESRYCGDLRDELKENISPLRTKPGGTVEPRNVVYENVAENEKVGSHLLIVEDMGTPLRRTTYVKDAGHCSPKCVTRMPERRIVSTDGFHSSLSPQMVPDCYATPLRRTTFVKNLSKVKAECRIDERAESKLLVGRLERNCERNATRSAKMGVESHVALDSIPSQLPETNGVTYSPCLMSEDPLRDVSKSPLILESRLLHLQDVSVSDGRPRRSVASSRGSPTESEYHTAITTPYDESLSESEEFVDSNICSETITGDVSLCQQQLALRASREATFVSNDDTHIETDCLQDLGSKPVGLGPHIDCRQDEGQFEGHLEVITEQVFTSEVYVTEVVSSSHAELSTDVRKWEVIDFENAGNEQQFSSSVRGIVQADDVHYSATSDCVSPGRDGRSTVAGHDFYKRLSSTPLSDAGTDDHTTIPAVGFKWSQTVTGDNKVDFHDGRMTAGSDIVHGLFHIPLDNDISCSFNSQTFTKVCATPSSTADVSEAVGSYDRTYTKSMNHNSAVSLSGTRAASRPLFTDATAVTNCAVDESAGIVPLDAIQSGFCDTTATQPETYKRNDLPRPELAKCGESEQLFSFWSDGEASLMGRDVFSYVGGQTRHMISPGQKRQSLIARLRGEGHQHPPQSTAAVVGVGHGKREHLAGDASPVRKRPLIAALKLRE